MKKFKKLTSALLSLVTAVAIVMPLGLNASAAGISYKWTVDRSSSPDPYQHMGWKGNGKTNFSVDPEVHTENSRFSIKLENTDYNKSFVERTYNVEPNTYYKFSAMVKYSDYQLDPGASEKNSGAGIGIAPVYNGSAVIFSNHQLKNSASSDWTLLEYEFTTTDETTVNLCLQNGKYNGSCKGTAWFSDVKLEKAELTNNWNILAVVFKNVDATVPVDGKTVHLVNSFTDSHISDINTYALDLLPSKLKEISGNKVTVNSVDRFYIDDTLTEKDLEVAGYQDDAKTIPHGYNLSNKKSEFIQKTLDKYLKQKNYNQILVIAPIGDINGGAGGWGGTKYKGVNIASVIVNGERYKDDSGYPRGCRCIIHEICHGLEHDSKAINNKKTVDYHDLYNYPDMSEYDYQVKYLNDTLPDGKKGVESSAFYRPSGKYTIVDSDMTTGVGITPGSDSVKPAAPKFRAKSVSDTHVTFSWDAVPNVDGYQFVFFKAADYKEMTTAAPHDYDKNKFSTTWGSFAIGKKLNVGVRSVLNIGGSTNYSDWAYLTFTHAGAGITYGDINNDGKFDMADLSALIRMYADKQTPDKRTLKAAGVSDKDSIVMKDISNLISYYANR